jgi:hypothetical protein
VNRMFLRVRHRLKERLAELIRQESRHDDHRELATA